MLIIRVNAWCSTLMSNLFPDDIDFYCVWSDLTQIHSCKEEKGKGRLPPKILRFLYDPMTGFGPFIGQADTVAERHLTPEMER